MQIEWIRLGEVELLLLRGEAVGSPGEALGNLLQDCEAALRDEGLNAESIVFQRLWHRSRDLREAAAPVRRAFFSRDRRAGSSSFQSAPRFQGPGGIALEVTSIRAAGATQGKRIVDFSEPRHYPHYVIHGGLMFVSGMAVLAATLDEQITLSLADAKAALDSERLSWRDVIEARVFIERDHVTAAWVAGALDREIGTRIPRVTVEQVDGLATPGKLIEIEVVAEIR